MIAFLLVAALTLGGIGLFLAMPGGRSFGRAALVLLAGAAAALLTLLIPLAEGAKGQLTFAVLAVIGLVGAVRLITHSRPVYSALYFILVAISAAGMLVMMQAEFLAAALVVIYAGAILVTYVFVIMLAQQSGGPRPYDRQSRDPFVGVLCGFILLAVVTSQLLTAPRSLAEPASGPASAALGTVAHVGGLTLTHYIIAVQIAGILLLAAMVGAVAIARRRPVGVDPRETWEVG